MFGRVQHVPIRLVLVRITFKTFRWHTGTFEKTIQSRHISLLLDWCVSAYEKNLFLGCPPCRLAALIVLAPTTRVHQAHSCPPRGGLVQGRESECWGWGVGGGGFISLKIKKFKPSNFQVSKNQSLEVPKIQFSKFSKVQQSNIHFMFFLIFLNILIPHYKMFISYVLEDIDPICKIFKTH